MSLLEETKQLLDDHGVRPESRIGQNFCVDAPLMRRMVEYAEVGESDTVLEVGSGLGNLTRILSERAGRVIAVEVDPRLIRILRERLSDRDNVEVIEGDILDIPLPRYDKVVSNPPYSISSSLILRLIERPEKLLVLTLQKEFAGRLRAEVGSKNYGWLGVYVGLMADLEVLEQLSQKAFYPPPEVESTVVRIKTRRPRYKVAGQGFFQELVKHLFTERNRKVRNAISAFLASRTGVGRREIRILTESLPTLEKRPRMMSLEEFVALSNRLHRIFIESQRVAYNGMSLYVFPEVYKPSDDTYMLAEHLKPRPGDVVLDLGTGSGLLAIKAAESAGRVVAVDINPYAVECARANARLNGLEGKIEVRLGDLFEAVKPDERFNLVIFNPPYLPVRDEGSEWIEKAWSGGLDGRAVIERFLDGFSSFLSDDGRVLMVQSSLSDVEKTLRRLNELGFHARVIGEKKLSFEKLILLEASRFGSQPHI